MSSSASVCSGWGLGMACGLVMFLLGLYLGHQSVSKPGPYLSVLQSFWNLHVWDRKEALFLSSVSRYVGLSIMCTSDLEYFTLLSSVGCIGTLLVSVVSGRTRLPLNVASAGVFFWCETQSASRGSISEWKP